MDFSKLSITIVDDHCMVREAFANIIQKGLNPLKIHQFSSVEDVLEAEVLCNTDVLITDISLQPNEQNGYELIKHVKSMGFKCKVIVISMHENTIYLKEAKLMNVDGFVHKREASENITNAIEDVVLGKQYFSDDISRKIDLASEQLEIYENLFPKEKEVFLRVAKGEHVKKIAIDMDISVKTVHSHRLNLYKKFGFHSSFDITQYVLKHGILSSEDIIKKS